MNFKTKQTEIDLSQAFKGLGTVYAVATIGLLAITLVACDEEPRRYQQPLPNGIPAQVSPQVDPSSRASCERGALELGYYSQFSPEGSCQYTGRDLEGDGK